MKKKININGDTIWVDQNKFVYDLIKYGEYLLQNASDSYHNKNNYYTNMDIKSMYIENCSNIIKNGRYNIKVTSLKSKLIDYSFKLIQNPNIKESLEYQYNNFCDSYPIFFKEHKSKKDYKLAQVGLMSNAILTYNIIEFIKILFGKENIKEYNNECYFIKFDDKKNISDKLCVFISKNYNAPNIIGHGNKYEIFDNIFDIIADKLIALIDTKSSEFNKSINYTICKGCGNFLLTYEKKDYCSNECLKIINANKKRKSRSLKSYNDSINTVNKI